jgi:hypothetical protein
VGEGIGRRKELQLDELLRRLAYVDDALAANYPGWFEDPGARGLVAAVVVAADVAAEGLARIDADLPGGER